MSEYTCTCGTCYECRGACAAVPEGSTMNCAIHGQDLPDACVCRGAEYWRARALAAESERRRDCGANGGPCKLPNGLEVPCAACALAAKEQELVALGQAYREAQAMLATLREALREAVEVEREACAVECDRRAATLRTFNTPMAQVRPGVAEAADECAVVIRARKPRALPDRTALDAMIAEAVKPWREALQALADAADHRCAELHDGGKWQAFVLAQAAALGVTPGSNTRP